MQRQGRDSFAKKPHQIKKEPFEVVAEEKYTVGR